MKKRQHIPFKTPSESRSKQREIGQYKDEKTGVIVHVLEGPKEVKWRGVPVGGSE